MPKSRRAFVGACVLCVLLAGLSIYLVALQLDANWHAQFEILSAERKVNGATVLITEDEALVVARDAMRVAGYSLDEWSPVADDRTRQGEQYILRYDAGGGHIHFRSAETKRIIHFIMRREGDRYDINLSHGK